MLTGILQQIDNFGAVGAEDDESLLDYFLSTPAVNQIESGRKMLVLGRKGSGKTALVRYFGNKSPNDAVHIPLRLGQYPWNVHAQRKNTGASDIEVYSSSWRYLIAVKTLSAVLGRYKKPFFSKEAAIAREFLVDNYETVDVDLRQILTPNNIKLTKGTVGVNLPGLTKNEINWDKVEQKSNLGLLIEQISDALFKVADVISKEIGIKSVYLHFDELDLGLQVLTDDRRLLLIGLTVASRSIRNFKLTNIKILPVLYLRTDIWENIDFSDKNKIAEQLSYEIVWDSTNLRRLVDQRVRSKVENASGWDSIHNPDEKMRGSQPKWDYIIARTFLRPRDVIAYLNYALDIASGREEDEEIFSKEDIYDARPQYSRYLRDELHEEISPHWPQWEEPLRACSAIATMVIKRETFNQEYEKRRNEKSFISATALESLYVYSVVGYRRGLPSGGTEWIFSYTNPQLKFDPLATQIKIHLGLKEYFGLSEKTGE
jgi:GTPase SAR1 family protein